MRRMPIPLVRTLHWRPHHLPHLPLHGLILCDPCHGPLVRHGLPAFGISRRPRLRSSVAAGRVVTGSNRPRLLGGGHAGTQWKRGCYNQQKSRKMHFPLFSPPKTQPRTDARLWPPTLHLPVPWDLSSIRGRCDTNPSSPRRCFPVDGHNLTSDERSSTGGRLVAWEPLGDEPDALPGSIALQLHRLRALTSLLSIMRPRGSPMFRELMNFSYQPSEGDNLAVRFSVNGMELVHTRELNPTIK